ncbi:MAG: hypothetical protein ACON42_06090, partial [Flavobacteriaceae bacterium]
MIRDKTLSKLRYAFFCLISLTTLYAQDTTGPVLSSFTQSSTLDITTGAVTVTFYITASDSSTISSVSTAPFLYSNVGSPTIATGYNIFSNWSVDSTAHTNWSPTSDSSLKGWYDASITSNISTNSNGEVTSFSSRGYGPNMSKTSSRGYAFSGSLSGVSNLKSGASTQINGLNTIYFQGPNNTSTLQTSSYNWGVSDGNYMILGTAHIDGLSHQRASLWSLRDTDSNQEDVQLRADNSSNSVTYPGAFYGAFEFTSVNTTNFSNDFSSTSFVDKNVIHSSIFNATTNSYSNHLYASNQQAETNANGTYTGELDNKQELYLMSNREGQRVLTGNFGELLIYNSTSETLRQKVEGYLAHKWGMEANLKSDHPYKSEEPKINYVYTYAAELLLDPDKVPDGTYKINLNTAAFVDSNSNSAPTPTGYNNFTLTVVNNPAPTVTLSSTDSDAIVSPGSVVTITATFSESMSATPTISLSGIVSNQPMTGTTSAAIWKYRWTVAEGATTTVTVSGADLGGKAYSGTDSLTFTIKYLPQTPTLTTEASLGKDVNLDGDTSDPVYLITNLAELLWISEQSENSSSWADGKVFLQTQDIDASPTRYWDDDDQNDFSAAGNNEGWLPIGFNGTFDGFYNGDYNKIIGLTINRTSNDPLGFIAQIYGQSVDDQAGVVRLGIIDGKYTIKKGSGSGYERIGGVIGRAYTIFGTAKLTDMFFEGEIKDISTSGGYQIGGLIGEFVPFDPSGAVENSYSNVQATGYRGGGLIGRFSSGAIKNVYARGSFTKGNGGEYAFGGIAESTTPNIDDISIKYAYSSVDFINISTNKIGAIAEESDEEYDGTGPEKGYFNNIYFNSDFGFDAFHVKDLTDNTYTSLESVTTTFLKSDQVIAPTGLLSSSIWGQNDNINDGFPYLKGWKDFGLSKNGISTTASAGDIIGSFIFNDAGSGATITYQLTTGDFDNQYFTIDTSTITPRLKITSAGAALLSSTTSFTILVQGTTNETPADVLLRKFVLPVKDMTAPTVILTSTDSDNIINYSSTITITATFSEGMSNYPTISIGDGVSNAVLSSTTSAIWTYFLDMTAWTGSSSSVNVTVQGEDSSENQYAGTDSITFILDTTSPTVILTDSDADNVLGADTTVTVTATFSENMATAPRITIGDGVTNVAMTSTSSSVWSYILDMSTWTGSGPTAVVTVSGTDIIGNAYSGTDSITFTLDTTAPTVTLADSDADDILGDDTTVTVTATFSENMVSTPRISIGDGVTNVAMTSTSSSVWSYVLDMSTWTGSGPTAVVTVSGTDIAGNAYTGTDSITFTLDTTAPTVTVTDSDADDILGADTTVTVTATFSENMATAPRIT